MSACDAVIGRNVCKRGKVPIAQERLEAFCFMEGGQGGDRGDVYKRRLGVTKGVNGHYVLSRLFATISILDVMYTCYVSTTTSYPTRS